MGYTAAFATSASIYNLAMGFEAGQNLNGDENILLGYRSGKALAGSQGNTATSGCRNVLIGRSAGSNLTSGSYNVVVGADSYLFGKGATNQTILGKGVTGQADNSVVLGNSSVTKVYMAQDGAAEIFANGTINTSDRRLKENIDDSDLGLEFINKVRPVRYTYINDKQKDGKTKYGIIAQEVQEVLKEINNEDFAGIKDGNPDKLGADYVQFIAPLIKSVQELTEMVKAQQKEIEELKK
jgi:trimeric autotransporter adhesin